MRILVVEDEHLIANSVKKGLEQERYAVDVVYDGTSGFDLAVTEDYDVIILDLMLPGMDGMAMCKELRKKQIHTPILMLTARGQVQDKVEGLTAGADDYLAKPFSFEELVARVRALTRRPQKIVESEIDPQKYGLSSKEFSLLEYFLQNPDKIISKDQIISHIWNYDADVLPNTVEAHVRNLRKKMGKDLIRTVRGFGYKLEKQNV